MGEEVDLQLYMERILERVPGLLALIVSDRDGVILLQVGKHEGTNKESYLAVFGAVVEQASKLQLGKNRHLTAFYKDHILVHFNQAPLVVSAIAAPDANIGLLLSLQTDLRGATDPLRVTIKKQLETF